MNPAIVTKKLTKRYVGSPTFALKDLSISVSKGEVYGFLGPNGAGKSTTIRALLNIIQPTSGSAEILGLDIVKDSVKIRRSVGYLSGDFVAYPKMTGRQFLNYMGELQPLKRKSYISELAKTFNVNLNKKLGDMSKGNRQKVGVIQAFMHEPDILILDEPTSGLDPLMQEAFYDLVHKFKEKGATLFVSSHNLAEVQKMCDRVGFIRDGKLFTEKVISDLALAAAQTFDITFKDKPPIAELRRIKGVKLSEHANNSITLHWQGSLSPLFVILAKNQVKGFSSRELNLEQEFMRFYEKGGRT